jgi:hypothetical protein
LGVKSTGKLTVKFNNITNCDSYAISATTSTIVNHNYIANNNGKQGVDTTGEQSDGVIYTNQQTSPVIDAGCEW